MNNSYPSTSFTNNVTEGQRKGRARRASARETFLNRMRSTNVDSTRIVTWGMENSRNEYTFHNAEQNDMAWRFAAFVMNCIAYGRPQNATRAKFIEQDYDYQVGNPSFAKDFFAAAKTAKLFTEAYRNENGEIVYSIGPNWYAFTQGNLVRTF